MLKRLLFIGLLLIVNCQLSIVNCQTPEELLKEVAQRAFAEGYVDIDFTVYMGDGDTEGSILVQGDKFVLEAAGMKTWFDGKTQWTYVEANEEVSVSEPSAEELQTLNPYAWMSLYEQGYELKFGETAVPGVRKVIMTTTIPREEMQSIVLMIHETELYPIRISMASRGGRDVTVIDVVHFDVMKQPLPESAFVFDKKEYPGVEIIDLR
ncbi:MAG: hypothetical protein J6U14_09380 [Bacteroidaceae bacterium]|nr:hypothetical protein [Bacteroidaceae bacterium]